MLLNALNLAIELGRRVSLNLFLGSIQQVHYALITCKEWLSGDKTAGMESTWMPPTGEMGMNMGEVVAGRI